MQPSIRATRTAPTGVPASRCAAYAASQCRIVCGNSRSRYAARASASSASPDVASAAGGPVIRRSSHRPRRELRIDQADAVEDAHLLVVELEAGAVRIAQVQAVLDTTIGAEVVDLLVVQRSLRGVELLLGDREGDVLEAADRLLEGGVIVAGEVEEPEQVAVPDVEEEVRRSRVVAVLDHLHQREAEQSLIEVDRLLDIAADQRDVVNAAGGRRPRRRLEVGDTKLVAVLADPVEFGTFGLGHARSLLVLVSEVLDELVHVTVGGPEVGVALLRIAGDVRLDVCPRRREFADRAVDVVDEESQRALGLAHAFGRRDREGRAVRQLEQVGLDALHLGRCEAENVAHERRHLRPGSGGRAGERDAQDAHQITGKSLGEQNDSSASSARKLSGPIASRTGPIWLSWRSIARYFISRMSPSCTTWIEQRSAGMITGSRSAIITEDGSTNADIRANHSGVDAA